MLKLTKTGIGLLTRQYRSVLKKCFLINAGVFGLMAKTLRGTLNAATFNVADGLLASAVMATIATTLALSSPANADELDRQVVEAGQTVNSIAGTFYDHTSSNVEGYLLYNAGTVNSMNVDARRNVSSTDNNTNHSLIYSYGYIGTLSGIFRDNQHLTTSGFNSGDDGPIMVMATSAVTDTVNLELINNANLSTSTPISAPAGMFYITGRINHIYGTYTGNYVEDYGYYQDDCGIASAVWAFSSDAVIGDINATFNGNYAIAHGGNVIEGSAIYSRNGSISSIAGSFINNYIQASTNMAKGGAIWNTGTITNIGTSSNKVTFSGNYAQSTDGTAQGGAIYNEGMIGNIYADFVGNRVISSSNSARGSAIYNTGTINNITGRFENNVTQTPNYTGSNANWTAGAVMNMGGNIKISNSYFTGNILESDVNKSGRVGNSVMNDGGKIIIKNTTFTGNSGGYGTVYNSGVMSGVRGKMLLDGVEISNNTSIGYGAALENYYGDFVTFNNSNILNNISLLETQGVILQNTVNIAGDMTFVDTNIEGNSSPNSSGGALVNNGIVNFIAISKNISLKNNTSLYGYRDVTNYNTLNLNVATNNNISFGGTIAGSGTININKSGLTYKDLIDDNTFTERENSITQTGGKYIFNNAISGGNVNIYNGANVKFGSLLQSNNTTSYGSFALNSLTNDANGGHIDMRNSHIDSNSATDLSLSSTLKIGIDLQHPTTGTTGLVDNITYTTGSGSIIIDAINEIGTRPTATGTYLYQVLNGSGVTLALTDAIKTEWNTDTTTSSPKVRDPIAATTAWTDKIYNRWTDTRVQGSLDVSGNNLVYSVINTQTAQSEVAGDTLALVTTATNNASRIFSTTDATAEYLLSTNLGAVNAVYKNLSINGTVSSNNRSTLNLGNYNGFVLDSSDDNLSLSSMKVSGGTDYSVNLANSGSKLDVADVIMDSTAAPIVGSGNATFTGDNEINTKVLNTGTTTVSSGTTDFNDEVAGFTVSAPATVSIAANNITDETTNNGTLELEGGTNIDTPKILSSRLLGAGKLRIMNSVMLGAGNSATTGQLYFGSSSDYADSILTSSSAASTSDHALVTAGYLDNNYYMNYGDSMTKSFTKAANDNHKNVIVMSAFKPSSYGKRSATIGSRPNQFAEILVSSTRMTRKESTRMTGKESIKMTGNATTTKQAA